MPGLDHETLGRLPLMEPAAVLGLPWVPTYLPVVRALLDVLSPGACTGPGGTIH